MGKGKLAKFADMAGYPHVFEYSYEDVASAPCPLYGRWGADFFGNERPIVLELGCGRGEYTLGLARRMPQLNFIGVDIKGARMWSGATEALREGLKNVAFLRTRIEVIDRMFAPDEVEEIWITFPDPQMKKATKRLTSTYFLARYRHFLRDGGIIHLKTDSPFLFTYTRLMVEVNGLPVTCVDDDLHGTGRVALPLEHGDHVASLRSDASTDPDRVGEGDALRSIRTYYEQQWMDRGKAIKYIRFALPQEGTLIEPDVDIELDDYRSYNRSKRSTLSTGR